MLDAVKTIQPVDVPSQELKAPCGVCFVFSALLKFHTQRLNGGDTCGMPRVQAAAPRQPG